MVALICCRRQIAPADYWPVLLGDAALRPRFMALWTRRWDEIAMDCLATEFVSPVLGRVFVPDEPRG